MSVVKPELLLSQSAYTATVSAPIAFYGGFPAAISASVIANETLH
jgi:hypothetical protein